MTLFLPGGKKQRHKACPVAHLGTVSRFSVEAAIMLQPAFSEHGRWAGLGLVFPTAVQEAGALP